MNKLTFSTSIRVVLLLTLIFSLNLAEAATLSFFDDHVEHLKLDIESSFTEYQKVNALNRTIFLTENFNENDSDCCEKRGGSIDKPDKLTFIYTGGGCSFNSINSSEGKHKCINGTSVSGPQFISVLDDGQLIGGARTINEGDIVEIFVKKGGGNDFGNELQVRIGSQVVEIHTSCSDALVSGANYGALRLTSVLGDDGTICGPPPNPCVATFTNHGNQIGLLWQYFGNNQWSNNSITIQPGVAVTQNVEDGQIWEIWNQADDRRIAQFTIDCDGPTDYCFTENGPISCLPPEECPTPILNASTQEICPGEPVIFTAMDLGFPCLAYNWNFGNNATPSIATGLGPISVVFANAGAANVSLTIDNNCENTTPPNPPVVFGCCNQDERGEHDHPHQLILEYVGGSTTNVTFTDGDNFTFFSGQVSNGDIFTVDGTGHTDKHGEQNRLETDTHFRIGGSSERDVHTSCSQDISPGFGITSNGDLIQNGTSSNSVFIVRGIVMLNTGSATSIYCEEGITDPDGGNGGNSANGTMVCGSNCFDCVETTTINIPIAPCVGSIGDFVFQDDDGDGIQDSNESGVPNVTVELKDCSNQILATTTTNAQGAYNFGDLVADCYRIQIILPNNFSVSPQNQGGNDALDSDINPISLMTGNINLESGENDSTNDAGLVPDPEAGNVGNQVWSDLNNNGVRDSGEPGIPDVEVKLQNTQGVTLVTTTTDDNGIYQFTDVQEGSYKIMFNTPNGFAPAPRTGFGDNNADDNNDNNPVNGNMTDVFFISSGESNQTIDAGFTPQPQAGSIGNHVWNDTNNNGIKESGEPGIGGVEVKLQNPQGVTLVTTRTDGNGAYQFTNVQEGSYKIMFGTPTGFDPAPRTGFGDNNVDDNNDNNPANGNMTDVFFISSGENNPTIDAGFIMVTTPTCPDGSPIKTPGTACDDGNPNTINDQIQANGCSCTGDPVNICDNITYGGKIGFGEACAGTIEICDNATDPILIGNCTAPSGGSGELEIIWLKNEVSCNTPTGTVAQMLENPNAYDWKIIPNSNQLSLNPGMVTTTTCFLRCTRRAGCDIYQGESNIVQIAIRSNCGGGGGTTESCSGGTTITYGNGSITMQGGSFYQIFDMSWNEIYGCGWQCGNSKTVDNLPAGDYRIYIKDSGYRVICEKVITLTAGGGGSSNPCDSQGGDHDNDGVCANEDCDDNNPNVPAAVGSSCDDGDANTSNDVIQSDGCTCVGTPTNGGGSTTTESCGGGTTITYGNGSITMQGGSFFQIFDISWNEVYSCGWQCGNSKTVSSLVDGEYRVYIKDAGYQVICDKVITLTSGGSGSSNPCDSQGGDHDNDGVCANEDCDDNNPNVPAAVGSSCDDGNPSTSNDVIQSDGCTCAGTADNGGGSATTVTCGDLNITYGGGIIDMVGPAGKEYYFTINDLNNGWAQVFGCGWNCGNQQTATNLPNSTYLVTIRNSDWSTHCSVEITMTGSSYTNSASSRNVSQLNFEAYHSMRSVELQWLTNSGYKVSYFEVDRSTDGKNFTKVNQFVNKLWSNTMEYHETTDRYPEMGNNYYRLKEVYLDGSYIYTDLKLVNFNIDLESIAVFPNPAQENLFINLKSLKNQEGTITITNQYGQVAKLIEIGNIPEQLLEVDIKELTNGLYYLQINLTNRPIITRKVLIQRLY